MDKNKNRKGVAGKKIASKKKPLDLQIWKPSVSIYRKNPSKTQLNPTKSGATMESQHLGGEDGLVEVAVREGGSEEISECCQKA